MVTLVIDTSAIVACVTAEPEAAAFISLISLADRRLITSVNALEARLVLTFGKGLPPEAADTFLTNENIEIVPFDALLADLAFVAYRLFGKGQHPARLNIGDCAAYALAKAIDCRLLYKGHDFTQTDIERA